MLRTNQSKVKSICLEKISTSSHFFKPVLSLMFPSLVWYPKNSLASSNGERKLRNVLIVVVLTEFSYTVQQLISKLDMRNITF